MKRAILLFLIAVTIAYALTSSKAKKRKLAILKKAMAPRKSIKQIPVYRDEIRDEPPKEDPWSEQNAWGASNEGGGDFEPSPWNVLQMTNDEGYDEETPVRLPLIPRETLRRDINTIAKTRV